MVPVRRTYGVQRAPRDGCSRRRRLHRHLAIERVERAVEAFVRRLQGKGRPQADDLNHRVSGGGSDGKVGEREREEGKREALTKTNPTASRAKKRARKPTFLVVCWKTSAPKSHGFQELRPGKLRTTWCKKTSWACQFSISICLFTWTSHVVYVLRREGSAAGKKYAIKKIRRILERTMIRDRGKG